MNDHILGTTIFLGTFGPWVPKKIVVPRIQLFVCPGSMRTGEV